MKFLARLPRWANALLGFFILYFAMDAILHLAGWWYHIWTKENDEELKRVHVGLLLVTSIFFGVVRAGSNHPARNVAYRNWLRSTPWRPGMPLPLGPAMLHWRDGVGLLILCALGQWNAGVAPAVLLLLFGCAYCVSCLLPLLQTRRYAETYGIALAGSALFWIAPWPVASLVLVAALVGLAQVGLARSLRGFPWEFPESNESNDAWPLRIYADLKPRVPLIEGVLIALLIASWVSGIVHVVEPPLSDLVLWLIFGSVFASTIRYGIYHANLRPPVTILGRLRAGRIIFRNYDHAKISPLLAMSLAIIGSVLIYRHHMWLPLGTGLTAFMVLLTLLIMGPQLRTWQLTGFHRVTGLGAGRHSTGAKTSM